MKKSKELNEALKGIKEITKICNDIEKVLLIESVKNKILIKSKNDIEKLRDLLVNVFENIIKSDLIDMEIAILYENGVYLGVISNNYVVYNKFKNDDEITILSRNEKLKNALKSFYRYAYKEKLKKDK